MKSSRNTFSERNLHGRIAHDLGKKIVKGDYREGEILPNETQICNDLNVSRTAVREAFKVLAAKGLLESRPKVGTRVKSRDDWNKFDPDIMAWGLYPTPIPSMLMELMELRTLLFPQATYLATLRADQEGIETIEASWQAFTKEKNDERRFTDAEAQFFCAIFAASGNSYMTQLCSLIALNVTGHLLFKSKASALFDQHKAHYERLLRNILSRTPQASEQAMRTLTREQQSACGFKPQTIHEPADLTI